jgi:serine/threonine-protein kinase
VANPSNVLADRYRVDRSLARGGLAEVWAGYDLLEDRPIAIKVLRMRAGDQACLVERFVREAELLRRIEHPCVCRLLEIGRTPEDSPFLILEFLSGETLSSRLDREMFLPFSEVGAMVMQVLEGLVAVHGAGIVHRDLKPSNIFLAQDDDGRERPVILDFGISKLKLTTLEDNAGPMLTSEHALMGSLCYMAPEQIDSAGQVDERADIYAVGAIMFRALAGRPPFGGIPAPGLIELKRAAEPPSISRITGDRWPAGVERFLGQTLARLPQARFPSAKVALERLRALLEKNNKARSRRPRKPRVAPTSMARDECSRTMTYHGTDEVLDPGRGPGRG